jgi:hypothetical protein
MTSRILVAIVLVAVGVNSFQEETFKNEETITMPEQGPASPYPSEIEVTKSANFSGITITFHNVDRAYWTDVRAILVSPSGKTVTLYQNSVGFSGINPDGVTFSFSESASDAIYYSVIEGNTYLPSAPLTVPLSEPGNSFFGVLCSHVSM